MKETRSPVRLLTHIIFFTAFNLRVKLFMLLKKVRYILQENKTLKHFLSEPFLENSYYKDHNTLFYEQYIK